MDGYAGRQVGVRLYPPALVSSAFGASNRPQWRQQRREPARVYELSESQPRMPNAAASNEGAAVAISRLARVRVVCCNTVSGGGRRMKPGFRMVPLLPAPLRSPLPRIEHSSIVGLKDMSLIQKRGGERSRNNDLQEDFAYLGSTSICKTESQCADKTAVLRPLRQPRQRFAAARAGSLRSRHPR